MEAQGSTSRELLELQAAQKELQRRHELTQQRCARESGEGVSGLFRVSSDSRSAPGLGW